MMKYFHHRNGHQKEFINGLALLHNFIPYQVRAKHAGENAVQVEQGKMPDNDWLISLLIVTTAGGYIR